MNKYRQEVPDGAFHHRMHRNDWITNYGTDNLLHDVRENWRYM